MLVCLRNTRLALLALTIACYLGSGAVAAETGEGPGRVADGTSANSSPARAFSPYLDGKWIGEGISYGPYREGQAPGIRDSSVEEIAEDLAILSKRWHLIRVYGSGIVAKNVLEIIHKEKLPLRVMVGVWLVRETESDAANAEAARIAKRDNLLEAKQAIRLANDYPEEVIAVNVGNETQVYWSSHRMKQENLIRYIRLVRSSVEVPVTTADDFNFWNKPESKVVANEVDFIVTHIHALWAGLDLAGAMPWTEKVYQEVCQYHPDKTVVIGEAGWATQVHNEGEQAQLIKGEANEEAQRVYYQQFADWAREHKICTFFFEAFDEPWKGGAHPDEVEKHWGLFRVDRQPKAAIAKGTE